MKNRIICLLILAIQSVVFAQQDPQYTQYMYNQNIINPAYATSDLDILNLGALHRTQWNSAVGAPKTYTFFAHAPISKKIQLGLSFVTDNIGDGALKENNMYADFAYVLPLNKKHKLSFGLKAGITNFNTNFNDFKFPDDSPLNGIVSSDDAFANQNNTFPNFGAGLFYFTDDYYFGVSAPNFLKTKQLEEKKGLNRLGSEDIHFFATGGYVYQLNNSLKLKPSFMTKAVKGSPLVLDTSLNVLYKNRYELGVSHRLNDSFSGMFNIGVTYNLRIGYAYDFTTSNLSNFNSGTHEILILFDLDLLGIKKGYDTSPRFF